eukprot:COSAG01_NODE_9860_length_2319_cov_1.036937_2_plen_53_part_00
MMAMKEEIDPLNQELARMRDHQVTLDKFKENDLLERQKSEKVRAGARQRPAS